MLFHFSSKYGFTKRLKIEAVLKPSIAYSLLARSRWGTRYIIICVFSEVLFLLLNNQPRKGILDKKGIAQAINYVNSLKLPNDVANKIIDEMKKS